MKPFPGFFFFLVTIALFAVAATVEVQTDNIYIQNSTDNEVKFRARSGTNQTAPFMEFVKGGTSVFSVSANGGITAVGLQSGTVTSANGFLMTNTFSTAFASAPVLTVSGPTNALPHIVSITTSNFVVGAAATNKTLQWIAFGTP